MRRDYPTDPQALSGRLLLVDRGYFDLAWFQRLQDGGGFYIARAKNNINPTVVSAHREDGKMLKHVQGKELKTVQKQAAQATTNGIDCCLEKKAKPQSRQDWLRSGSSGKRNFPG